MKNGPVILLGTVVVGFGIFIGLQVGKQLRRPKKDAPTAADTGGSVALRTQDGDLVRVRRSNIPPPGPKNYAEIARIISDGREPTYIDEVLRARGDHIARWVDRSNSPITVWVQHETAVRDYWPDYPALARDAFYNWSGAAIPLKFLFIDDSASAEVRVKWVDHFPDAAAGKTYWARDVNWWILGADIELALHSQAGQAYDREAVHAIALHEVGHLIGLDHASNIDNIMAPRVHTLRLSSADLKTANLIYKLPPGSIRDTASTKP